MSVRSIFSVIGFVLLSSQGWAVEPTLQAGAAKIDITPPVGVPMWGYAVRRDAPSIGTLDPLYARAVVLSVDNERLAIVSLDLGRAPTRDSMKKIRAAVNKATGIEHLMLTASHTHHGPVLELPNVPKGKKPYVHTLEQKLIQVIIKANKQLQPAQIAIARKDTTYNRNRHSKREDRPTDPELLVMRLATPEKKTIAHLVNFAAHPTMIPARTLKWSADWAGVLATSIEKKSDAPCLVLQGAAGDLSMNIHGGHQRAGKTLGDLVWSMSQSTPATPLVKNTLQITEDDFRFEPRIALDNLAVKTLLSNAFFPEFIAFWEREYREGVRPHLTTALLGGEIGFVGVSGEFFCEHSLSLKRRARLKHVFFLGYCNDYQQYFPTIQAAAEGGYGAQPPMNAAEVGAGEQMINRALVRLYKMRGKLVNLPPQTEQTSKKNSSTNWLLGHAMKIPSKYTNQESGYFAIVEGLNEKLYIGTAKYGVNAYLLEFDPTKASFKQVVDVHKSIGSKAKGFAAQAKIHTRNNVGASGKIYFGSKQGYPEKGEKRTDYLGGYTMTYDPKTGHIKHYGIAKRHHGIISVTPDESRGLAYISTCSDSRPIDHTHFMVLDLKTGKYQDLGDMEQAYAFIIVDHQGRAYHPKRGGQIARYDPDMKKLEILDITMNGKSAPESFTKDKAILNWEVSPDRKTLYAVEMTTNGLYSFDLTAKGKVIPGKKLGTLLEAGKKTDCRGLCVSPKGMAWMVVTERGRKGGPLAHLVSYTPGEKSTHLHGPIGIKNPNYTPFKDDKGKALPWHHTIRKEKDGTMTPWVPLGICAAKNGDVYVLTLAPFTLLRFDKESLTMDRD